MAMPQVQPHVRHFFRQVQFLLICDVLPRNLGIHPLDHVYLQDIVGVN